MRCEESDLSVTYILDGLEGILTLAGVQSSISVLVKELRKNKVSIAHNAISIEVEADVGDEFSSPIGLDFGHGAIRVCLITSLPPGWNLDFLVLDKLSLLLSLRILISIQILVTPPMV